jgi:hypothetical protein
MGKLKLHLKHTGVRILTPLTNIINATFTGADGNLNGYTPDVGQTLAILSGALTIKTNKAAPGSNSTTGIGVFNSGYANVRIRATLHNNNLSTRSAGLFCRATDADNAWLFIFSSGIVEIVERNAAAQTVRASTAAVLADDTDYDVIISCYGNILRVFVPALSIYLTYTSTFNNTATRHGLRLMDTSGSAGGTISADNFTVTHIYGDAFAIAGQSNASGRGTNSQVFTQTAGTGILFANDYNWKTLVDPTDDYLNQVDIVSQEPVGKPGGSVWPLLSNLIVAYRQLPVVIIPGAMSGVSVLDWLPGVNHLDRTTLYGSMVYRSLMNPNLSGVLWWQGETDATNGMSQADYDSNLDTVADAVYADLGVKLIVAKVHTQVSPAASDESQAVIKAAIAAVWADNAAHVSPGPDLSVLTADNADGAHLNGNALLSSAATLWWNAIKVAFGW